MLNRSFVTSFLGMNVTDVRDINRDQKIFWFSAIPLTFVVVSLSIIYGYKWEELREMLKGTPHSTHARRIAEEDLEPSRQSILHAARSDVGVPLAQRIDGFSVPMHPRR